MNVYVKTGKSMTGMVVTGDNNQVYMYKAFQNKGKNEQEQILLAVKQGVCFSRNNKIKYATNSVNIYSDIKFNIDSINKDEYLNRFNYCFSTKEIETEQDKQRMLLATKEIVAENHRLNLIGIKSR